MLIAFVVFLEKRKIQFIIIWKSASKISWTTIADVSDFCIVTRAVGVQSRHVKTDIGKPINKSITIDNHFLIGIDCIIPWSKRFFLDFFSPRDWERASREGEKPLHGFNSMDLKLTFTQTAGSESDLQGWLVDSLKTKQNKSIWLIRIIRTTEERQLLKYCIGNSCKRCILLHIHFQDSSLLEMDAVPERI